METLAQTFLGAVAIPISTLGLSASLAISTSISPVSPSSSSAGIDNQTRGSSSLSGSAIGGIVIGAVVGIALIGAAWFFIARRSRSTEPLLPAYAAEDHRQITDPKTQYTYEADGAEPQVFEISAATVKDHEGRVRVHEIQ